MRNQSAFGIGGIFTGKGRRLEAASALEDVFRYRLDFLALNCTPGLAWFKVRKNHTRSEKELNIAGQIYVITTNT